MSADSFSARDHLSGTGLGSILRDQKILSGTSRANVLFGVAHTPAQSATKSPVRSIASSPIESNSLEAEDSDELNEEDVWEAEVRPWQDSDKGSQLSKGDLHWQSVKEDIGLGFADIGKQRINAVEAMRPSRRRTGPDKGPGFMDAFPNAGAMGLSPLSRTAEIASSHASCRPTPSRLATGSRMIPQPEVFHDSNKHVEHQSAPVNVPDWTKILGAAETKSKRNAMVEDDGDEDDDRLPPHELLDRENARSQRSTFSVCEGQGRTLKGRDLSRVRNAVWRQIGFAD